MNEVSMTALAAAAPEAGALKCRDELSHFGWHQAPIGRPVSRPPILRFDFPAAQPISIPMKWTPDSKLGEFAAYDNRLPFQVPFRLIYAIEKHRRRHCDEAIEKQPRKQSRGPHPPQLRPR